MTALTRNKIRLNTHSREDAITASTMLADGLGISRIKTGKTNILIIGGDGKSLIVDAMARHVSDHHSAQDMPADRFVEGAPMAAADRRQKKIITCGNAACAITLTHLFDDLSKALEPATPGTLRTLKDRFSPPPHDSIHFVTAHHASYIAASIQKGDYTPDMTIEFNDPADLDDSIAQNWDRQWIITIHNAALLTPAMKAAMNELSPFKGTRPITQDRAIRTALDR